MCGCGARSERGISAATPQALPPETDARKSFWCGVAGRRRWKVSIHYRAAEVAPDGAGGEALIRWMIQGWEQTSTARNRKLLTPRHA